MKMRWLVAIFAVGCVVLFAAFGIGWADWGKLANRTGVMQIVMGILGGIVVILVVIGILSRGKERWIVSTLAAVLLLGFSALVFFSIGWLMAPLALFLFGFSLWKLRHRPIACEAC